MGLGTLLALASAVLFGITTPIVASAGADVGPFVTASLLYAGAAAMALGTVPFGARTGRSLARADLGRLAAIALFGAVLAPSLFAWGVHRAGATTTSLALNLEAVFTMLLAVAIHHEPIGRRAGAAIVLVTCGGVALALDRGSSLGTAGVGAIAAATACWAVDNVLTRPLADHDPLHVIAGKGTLGAIATAALATIAREPWPAAATAAVLFACGATGYGLSLRLYLLAQRRIGAGRTGSVFAVGPFVGAAVSWALGDRGFGALGAIGGLALVIGVYLHLTERHAHRHVHEALTHEHAHRHDDGHHDHVHDPPFVGEHSHVHTHARIEHTHEHAPDLHHAHDHDPV
jgi:drug/metabolite transporter (DMT)-like permease